MESQTTVCIPGEDGMLVYTSTQGIDFTNIVIAACLKVQENSIQIVVTHLGGAFGAKETRSCHVACASAVACQLTGKPIRFVMSLESNMTVMGKRHGMIGEYNIKFDDSGKIENLKSNSYYDVGCSFNESIIFKANLAYSNCYDASLWDVKSVDIKSDAPSNTWCRGPGSLHAIAMTETIMEHIATVIGTDPMSVRMANFMAGSYIKKMIPDFLKDVGNLNFDSGI